LADIGDRLVYRVHAIERMVERGISHDDVRKVLAEGKEIESYPGDFPHPSRLVLGWCGQRPIHVVAAESAADNETIISDRLRTRSGPLGAGIRKEKSAMKCVICKNGETRPGKTTVTLERGGVTLATKGVPARICDNCGEAYVDEGITRRLLATAEEALRAGVQVDVREFVAPTP